MRAVALIDSPHRVDMPTGHEQGRCSEAGGPVSWEWTAVAQPALRARNDDELHTRTLRIRPETQVVGYGPGIELRMGSSTQRCSIVAERQRGCAGTWVDYGGNDNRLRGGLCACGRGSLPSTGGRL